MPKKNEPTTTTSIADTELGKEIKTTVKAAVEPYKDFAADCFANEFVGYFSSRDFAGRVLAKARPHLEEYRTSDLVLVDGDGSLAALPATISESDRPTFDA